MRFCDGCKQSVHYCDTIMDARGHAQGDEPRAHCEPETSDMFAHERCSFDRQVLIYWTGPVWSRDGRIVKKPW